MDNLCHTLVGWAMGEAGLKRKTRYGNAALMIAANLPDIDVLVFLTSTPSVEFRRGWTHGILAQLVLPIVADRSDRGIRSADGGAPPARPTSPLNIPWLLGALLSPACCRTSAWTFSTTTVCACWRHSTGAGSTATPCSLPISGSGWRSAAGIWLSRRRGTPRPARGALVFADLLCRRDAGLGAGGPWCRRRHLA